MAPETAAANGTVYAQTNRLMTNGMRCGIGECTTLVAFRFGPRFGVHISTLHFSTKAWNLPVCSAKGPSDQDIRDPTPRSVILHMAMYVTVSRVYYKSKPCFVMKRHSSWIKGRKSKSVSRVVDRAFRKTVPAAGVKKFPHSINDFNFDAVFPATTSDSATRPGSAKLV